MADEITVDSERTSKMSLKGKAPMMVDGKEDAPWVEKYRPQTLDDVAAHKEIVDTSKPLMRAGVLNTKLSKVTS